MNKTINKVCNVEDFTPEFQASIREHFPHVPGDLRFRKYWEWMTIVQAVDYLDCSLDESKCLGVGAGWEAPIFWLLRQGKSAQEVHATDIYLTPGWDYYAPPEFVANPDAYMPFPCERQKLIVQNMDARDLRYPDNHFDLIFSSSSVEHFGTLSGILQSVKEMARVTKPGGIIALTTEFAINGNAGYMYENTFCFHQDAIYDLLVSGSGCKLLEPLNFELSDATRATLITLTECERLAQIPKEGAVNSVPAPHIVISQNGFEIAPISVVLRK